MVAAYLVVFSVAVLAIILCIDRFLNCLILLENFNVCILLFSLLRSSSDSQMILIVLMVVLTIEIVVGLVVLTRLWESGGCLDSVGV